MRHAYSIYLSAVLTIASSASAQTTVPPAKAVSADTLLLKHVARVAWSDAPFNEVVEWLRAEGKSIGTINVIPRWRALATEDVTPDTPVTLEMEDTTVAQVLNEVLNQLSGRTPLKYAVTGNVLRITTRADLRSRLETRSYPVAEMIGQARAARVRPGIAVGNQTRFGTVTATPGGGLNGGGQTIDVGTTIFGDVGPDTDNDDDDALNEQFAQQIINMIQSTIEPDSWQVNGGAGTIAEFNGVLIVRNSPDVHARIAQARFGRH